MNHTDRHFFKFGQKASAIAWIACATCIACAPGILRADEAAEASPEKPRIQQIRVEVRILEWQLTNAMDFDFAVLFSNQGEGGILRSADLTLPAQPPLSSAARVFLDGLDAGHGSFEAVIEALETVGSVKILSQPAVIITVGDKDEGKVVSGTRIPYESVRAFGGVRLATTTEYRDTGIALQTTALPSKYEGLAHLRINASVTDLSGFINIGTDDKGDPLRVPVINSRSMVNEVIVRDRSVFIAGLLKSTSEIERRRGVPWIAELPILRWFLNNYSRDTETTELVFLVRPEILDPVEGEL